MVFSVFGLNSETTEYTQDIVVGVDPGSKKEDSLSRVRRILTLMYKLMHITMSARKLRNAESCGRGRRGRKCPNRKNRTNRMANKARIPAGTRARWNFKLKVLNWLAKMFPVTYMCVEDIKAVTRKGAKKWNQSFSPLEVGKQWFYGEIRKRWELFTVQGYETKQMRDVLGLKKTSNKMSEGFDAHCVDSWVLCDYIVGGEPIVDNTQRFCISPIPIRRRELHRQNPQKGGKRPRYGGTVCLGIAKNTLLSTSSMVSPLCVATRRMVYPCSL